MVKVHQGSTINIGNNVVINSKPNSNDILCHHRSALITLTPEARIVVEEYAGLSATILSARDSITIGKRTLIGAGVLITDSDHHPAKLADVSSRRFASPRDIDTAAVVIEDDVFIGTRSTVLKGVTIGRGSVIAAGSVVSRSIPPGVIAAGNPCRVISRVES